MSVAVSVMITASLVMLLVGALLALVRLALGPTALDRAIAIDVVSAAVIGVVVILIARWGRTDLMVLLIIFTLTAFFSTVTVAKYAAPALARRKTRKKSREQEGEATKNDA